MIGALAGDVIGSVHEGAGTKVKDFVLFRRGCRVTDDSVLTLAVAEVITRLGSRADVPDYAAALRTFGRLYPDAGYGGKFRGWVSSAGAGPYNSWGNGSAMRSAPVGWAFNSEQEVLEQAARTAAPTHNHPEGVKGAQAVALAVFLARTGSGKEAIRRAIAGRFGYDLGRTADQVRPAYRFDVSCQGSVPEAIIAFLDSTGVEDAIRTAISLGGDADTLACMAGAIAEAHDGGVPEALSAFVLPRLDGRLLAVTAAFARLHLPRAAQDAVAREVRARQPEASGSGTRPEKDDARYRVLVGSGTWQEMGSHARKIDQGTAKPGTALSLALEELQAPSLDGHALLEALLWSKRPRVFAESEVRGDGSDWTRPELSLLGGIGIAVPVTVFDDGTHSAPRQHAQPFRATLLFVPGALLQNGQGREPADWDVVRDGRIDPDRYFALYEQRLLPALKYAAASALREKRRALVTVPGLGCGQFAGKFRGSLGPFLGDAIARILERHCAELDGLAAVWYDPYSECTDAQRQIGAASYLVRPSAHRPGGRPQLCAPAEYSGDGRDFSGCALSSVVAWDHVSWPGNDFYDGARATDDGVKAAATDTMFALTGLRGRYDPGTSCYLPPAGYRTWGEVVKQNRLRLSARGRLLVVDTAGHAANS